LHEGILKEIKEWIRPTVKQINKENTDFILTTTTTIVKLEALETNASIVNGIIDYAKHNDVNLILIGSTGRTGFGRLLLGSVAWGVVNRSLCPVLVVK
jgi:nucleotide-binding universal stress UspA family protein